jgi:hypothetical protein
VVGDIDWTAFGLDPLGTQLLQPTEQGQESHSDHPSLEITDIDLLLGSGGDMPTSTMGATPPPATMSSGQDHLFGSDLLMSTYGTAPTMLRPHQFPPSPPAMAASARQKHSPSQSSIQSYSSSSQTSSRKTTTTSSKQQAATKSTSSSTSSSSKKRPSPSYGPDEDDFLDGAAADDQDQDDASTKRRRNTLAARRYRQRRLDRLSELEAALADMTAERDDLRVRLARREAEVGALREVLSASRR